MVDVGGIGVAIHAKHLLDERIGHGGDLDRGRRDDGEPRRVGRSPGRGVVAGGGRGHGQESGARWGAGLGLGLAGGLGVKGCDLHGGRGGSGFDLKGRGGLGFDSGRGLGLALGDEEGAKGVGDFDGLAGFAVLAGD